jgi:hypothetical protein
MNIEPVGSMETGAGGGAGPRPALHMATTAPARRLHSRPISWA